MDQVPRNNRWMDFEGLSYDGYTPNWGYPIQPRPTGTDLKVDHEGGSWSTTQSKGPYVPLPQVTSQPLNGATWDLRLVKCWCRFKQLGCKAGLCGLGLSAGVWSQSSSKPSPLTGLTAISHPEMLSPISWTGLFSLPQMYPCLAGIWCEEASACLCAAIPNSRVLVNMLYSTFTKLPVSPRDLHQLSI